MNTFWLVMMMSVGVYGLRFAGLALPDVEFPTFWQQALEFVPVALLTALVVTSLTGSSGVEPARLAAIGAGGLAAYRTRRMWTCIAAGMVVYWLLRLM